MARVWRLEQLQIERQENETRFQHHKRLIYGKLVDHTLSDVDYSELAEEAYGQSYSSDVCRRMFYGSKRTLDLLEEEGLSNMSDNKVIDDLESKIIELKKERQKLSDERTAFNKVVREQARREELHEVLLESANSMNNVVLDYTPSYVTPSDNDLIVSLTDLHYGIEVHNTWNDYSPEICRRMLCEYLDRIIEIAKLHGSENIYVCNNGDSISGKIHKTVQLANKENVIQQVKGVSELIAQFLAELSKHFNHVMYASVSGNHSRLDKKEDSPYDERLDDLIDWYLEARLQNFENVHIGAARKVDPSIYMIDVRGKVYLGVHGDFDAGSGKIASLQAMVGEPIYAVLCGHLHHCKFEEEHGVLSIMSGSFVGLDDYCVQKRLYTEPSQTVCVCDEDGVRCLYNVKLNRG